MAEVRILTGDCRDVLRTLDADSFDSCVTDPPYHLTNRVPDVARCGDCHRVYGGKSDPWLGRCSRCGSANRVSNRSAGGFMGQQWDGGDVAFRPETWAEVFRVLKPGAHLLAFGGTRTFHRMVCAIEDAGFEIRDTIFYCYGSGFPKSHNLDKRKGNEFCGCSEPSPEHNVRSLRDADVSPTTYVGEGRGPVLQPRLSEQGPSAETLQCAAPAEGAGELGVEGWRDLSEAPRELRKRSLCPVSAGVSVNGTDGRLRDGAPAGDGTLDRQATNPAGVRPSHRPRSAKQRPDELGTLAVQQEPQTGGAWPLCAGCGKPIIPDGLGTALKPAVEPICVARKPLIGTVAENVQRFGTGALNIDATRVPASDGVPKFTHRGEPSANCYGDGKNGSNRTGEIDTATGRWPANLCHDGSEEVLAGFPESAPSGRGNKSPRKHSDNRVFGKGLGFSDRPSIGGDSGSAARFFATFPQDERRFLYCPKATKAERGEGCTHPTVKPLALMQWLCRLVTPPGGHVLDPFAGSGSTGIAADREGFRATLIEMSPEYAAIARARIRADSPLFATDEAANG